MLAKAREPPDLAEGLVDQLLLGGGRGHDACFAKCRPSTRLVGIEPPERRGKRSGDVKKDRWQVAAGGGLCGSILAGTQPAVDGRLGQLTDKDLKVKQRSSAVTFPTRKSWVAAGYSCHCWGQTLSVNLVKEVTYILVISI